MSHTGTVIKPNQSPGIIRVVTLGAAISKKEPRILKIIVPSEDSKRYVVLLDRRKKKFEYGAAVRFNLKTFNKLSDPHKTYLIKHQETIIDYIKGIPGYEDIEIEPDFDKIYKKLKEFYFATVVRELKDNSVLKSFYDFIKVFDLKTLNKILDNLKEVRDFYFDKPMDINFMQEKFKIDGVRLIHKSDLLEGLKSLDKNHELNNEDNKPKEEDYNLKERDYEILEDEGDKIDYKDEAGVKKEIDDIGEHVISEESDLPTFA